MGPRSGKGSVAIYAVDAGGTRIKLGLVEDGRVLARATLDARSDEGLGPQLPRIAEALLSLSPRGGSAEGGDVRPLAVSIGVASQGERGRGEGLKIEGLGLAFPSLVDVETGRVTRDSGKYRDAMDLDLNAWCRHELGVPFAIENDARMACIGEWRYGAGRGVDDLVMVTLGTGVGTSAVMGGEVVRGRHGQAGILGGHFILDPHGHPCPCGAVGCVEAESSTATLPARAAEDPDFAASVLKGAALLDYAAVFRAAAEGDAAAVRLRDRALEVWGALTVSLIHAYDPEVVVFGGGILGAGEAILGPVRAFVARNAWMPWGTVRIVPSERGDDAALLACEWLVRSRHEK